MSTLPDSGAAEGHQALKQSVAQSLLSIRSLVVTPETPFTWASGLRSPIYCDNRISMGYPLVRRLIRDGFNLVLADWIADADVIVGTATAGIPHAAWLAELVDKPMAYVRSKPKGHGKRNLIEGPVADGATAVVIEDLISTGGSSIAAVEALRESGATVLGVGAIFSYRLPQADRAFRAANVEYRSLTDIHSLLEVARVGGLLGEEEIDSVRRWQADPDEWSKRVSASN